MMLEETNAVLWAGLYDEANNNNATGCSQATKEWIIDAGLEEWFRINFPLISLSDKRRKVSMRPIQYGSIWSIGQPR